MPYVPNHMSKSSFLVYACLSQVQKVHSAICAMSNFAEQRSAIKFCFRNDISAAVTYRMLEKAFGDETLSQKMFTSGTEILKKAENVSMICNSPSTSIDDQNIKNIKEMAH